MKAMLASLIFLPAQAADFSQIECKQADIKIEAFTEINLQEENITLQLKEKKIQWIGRNNKEKYYHALLYNRNYYRCFDNGHCYFKVNRAQRRTIILAPSYLDMLKKLYEQALTKKYSKAS